MASITNLITNPSAELDTTGWSVLVGTFSRELGDAPVGRYFIRLASTGSNVFCAYSTVSLVSGREYTFGFYARGTTPNSQVTLNHDSSTVSTISVTSQWQFYSTTFTATDNSELGIVPLAGGGTGFTDIDGLILTEGGVDYGYFDGDTPNTSEYSYTWNGAVQSSTSVRTEIPVLDDLILLSRHSLDKIVTSGDFSESHAGALAYTGGGLVNYPDIRTVTKTIQHDYGRAMFVRAVYSIDGGSSWQEANNISTFGWTFTYQENGVPIPAGNFGVGGPKMQLAVGCDTNNIYFRLIGNYFTYSTLIMNVNTGTFTATISGWTASPQTVMVKYWAYERGV